jgi:hypothetical protein
MIIYITNDLHYTTPNDSKILIHLENELKSVWKLLAYVPGIDIIYYWPGAIIATCLTLIGCVDIAK